MSQQAHIAVDLGAESGRVILGTIESGRLSIREVHRFRHLPIPTPGGLCWDLTGLWRNILDGLREAAAQAKSRSLTPVSVGVDTWGVDWALLGPGDTLLGLPRCYRDPAFSTGFESVTARVKPRNIYDATGIQLMPINSLYQVATRYEREAGLFEVAKHLLFMPDVFHWLLSGRACVERTIASTSQMVDVRTGDWNRALLDKLGLPTSALSTPTDPGTAVGTITDAVAAATDLPGDLKVVLPPTHDTASAVASVPAQAGTDWCYLSSGTWSLLGAELAEPCITDAAADANFTNELGVNGTVRFLKNIAGLWLVQEVRRHLARQGKDLDYAELTEQAAGAEPFRTLLPVNDPVFAQPGHAIDRIQIYAQQSGQPVPDSVGQLVRCCLESLALEYRQTLEVMERVLNRSFSVLHVVGGGGKNGLLNRMTAHATGRTVVVGPEEATAMGNLLTQAMGVGAVENLDAIRNIVAASVDLQTVEPDPSKRDEWSTAATRYAQLPPSEPFHAEPSE